MKLVTFLIASMMLLSACGAGDRSESGEGSPRLEASTSANAADTTASSKDDGGYSSSFILADPDGVQQITWNDLMPEGEELILAQLYEEYFSQLEQDMRARQMRLRDAGKISEGQTDITALITEGSAEDTMDQLGTFNVVEELDGMKVRLPGYVVPLNFNADDKYKEFLFVPQPGACLHTPPPPPNQIIYVTSEWAAEVEDIYFPFWIEGTMSTGRTDTELAKSAYELNLSKIEIYEF